MREQGKNNRQNGRIERHIRTLQDNASTSEDPTSLAIINTLQVLQQSDDCSSVDSDEEAYYASWDMQAEDIIAVPPPPQPPPPQETTDTQSWVDDVIHMITSPEQQFTQSHNQTVKQITPHSNWNDSEFRNFIFFQKNSPVDIGNFDCSVHL